MPDPARWFHLQQGVQQGPVDLDAMRDLVVAGTVRPDTYVWADGMPEWMPAARVPALVPPASQGVAGWPEQGPDAPPSSTPAPPPPEA